MNFWLTSIALLLGGMTLKWVLDIFFLRQVYRDNEQKLNVREAEFTTLKHEHSQALTDLKNKLTELDATTKAKALAEGNLAKLNSNLIALRSHLLRVEEELTASGNQVAELAERVATRDRELQTAAARLESLQADARELTSIGESLRLQLAEASAVTVTQSEAAEGLRRQLADSVHEARIHASRILELEGSLAAQISVTATLEAAVRSRDAQIADCQSRFAALEAERQSVAVSLKVADREIGIARGELADQARRLDESQQLATSREAELRALRSQMETAAKARAGLESAAKKREAEIVLWERQAVEGRQLAEAAAAENRRLLAELGALTEAGKAVGGQEALIQGATEQNLQLHEQLSQQLARIQALDAERVALLRELDSARTDAARSALAVESGPAGAGQMVALEPDPAWIHRIQDMEAELEAVSRSHARLETELSQERERSAGLEHRLRSATPIPTEMSASPTAGAANDSALLAEIDELNRERNALAAELAALKAATPPATGGTARKRKARAAEVDLFEVPAGVGPNAGMITTEAPMDDPAAAVTEFSATCPQHLSLVKGVGPVFEQRLYGAGVGSYWELAQLSDRTLGEVLELDERQREQFDFGATRADAGRLAVETRSVGRKWTGEQPDDLELIDGISPAIEKRLYDAGICTFAALAGTTVELLAEICPVAKFRGANHSQWIKEAKQRITEEGN